MYDPQSSENYLENSSSKSALEGTLSELKEAG